MGEEYKQFNFNFRELTFIKSSEEELNQIHNTVIMGAIFNIYKKKAILDDALNTSQYGYTASAKNIGSHKLLRITDINEGEIQWSSVPFCDCEESEKYLLKKGDILIARTGGTTGKTTLVKSIPHKSVFASYLIRLSVNKKYNPEYIFLFLNSYLFWNQILEMKNGTTQPNVNAEKMKKLEFSDCPIRVQDEIIKYKKEGLFNKSELLRIIDNKFKKIKDIYITKQLFKSETIFQTTHLTLFRQAILQEAIEGKLTADWRKKHRDMISGENSASKLLEKIKAEKEQLIKKGKIKKDKPLTPITDIEKPFALPDGWVWCRLPQILDFGDSLRRGPFGSSITKSMFIQKTKHATKVYEQKNAIYKDYSIGSYYIDVDEYPNLKSFMANPGDIIISCAGTIGETYLLPADAPPGVINQALLKIRLNRKAVDNQFFINVFKSQTRSQINEDAKGTAMKNISSVDYLKNELLFPLPPLAEQQAIVERVDKLMTMIDELGKQVTERKDKSERLMQSVLREAFEQ